MTVADQPGTARASKVARTPPPPPLQAFLPPTPRVELQPNARQPHWLALFEKYAQLDPQIPTGQTAAPANSRRKPSPDVADWLIMETLQQKPAPALSPELPKSTNERGNEGDLLDALVADHLERAAGPAAPQESSADGMLQREIDALLNASAPASSPAKPDAATADAPKAPAPEISAELTQAELDVLLPKTSAPAPAPEPAPLPTATSAPPLAIDEDTATKLNEAEGVLAEELAQLMAETQAAEKESPLPSPPAETAANAAKAEEKPEPAIPVAPAAAATTAEPAPPAPADLIAQTAAPVCEQPPAVATTPVPAVAPLPPPGVPDRPVVILLPDELPEDEEEPAPRWRITQLANDIALIIAQCIDLPFAWIDVVNKNLLGLAALLFLISGAALTAAAWWLSR